MEEVSWSQKSREIWLREGDKNTGFFHRMANAHKKSNWLRKIKINEVWCTEENEIQESMAKAFQSLLSKPSDWHLSLAGLDFDRLGNEDVAKLEVAFSEEEVFLALCELNGDKVPRLDEFTIAFWQFNKDFVKEEVLGFFREFHEQGKFVRSLNTMFLVLIPKKRGVDDLRDYRPIS